jgi:hypothetical protein
MQSVRELLEGGKMEIITQLNHDLDEARRIVYTLLRHVGQRGLCPRCGERITWLRHAKDSMLEAYNANGTQHTRTCTKSFTHEDPNER